MIDTVQFAGGIAGALVMAFVWYLIGYLNGRKRERHRWQDETIRRRFAVYHWENGKWYWADEEPTTSRDPAATKVAQNQAKILEQFGVKS
jgi:hypothetical protein